VQPATGLGIVAAPVSPGTALASVTFTATGSGSTAPYQYQFWLFDGLTWTMVQDWSAVANWTWTPTAPAITLPVGTYTIQVGVRTSPWVTWDVQNTVTYVVQ
jgi:hypothetical protein